ncbi:MAG: hypothetical protein JXA28_09550, partial [Bacteroidetes bacterium]|nr:hypothetical protein [Bacteroidota bacterium]
MHRIPLIPAVLLGLILFFPLSSPGQPAAFDARGVRSYLVNYGAIHSDRFLAEFAGRRFALIDEAGAADISLLRAVNPDLPILRYKDIVALHRSMPEFPALDRDESAFMHSCEPSGLQLLLRGDTAGITWLPDRRTLPIAGYRLSWHLDSLDGGHPLVDSLLTMPPVTVRLPKSAVFLSVATELTDGSQLNYGFPVRASAAAKRLLLWLENITETRTDEQVDIDITLRNPGAGMPDSVFIIADWDRNNQLDPQSERTRILSSGDTWRFSRSIDITGQRTFCGYEFRVEVWSNGASSVFPNRGTWHTNVNNRLINNTYGFYVMNVGSSAWRQSYVEQVLQAFSQRGYSGLFEDDCWYRVASYGGDAWPPEPYDDLQWRTDLYTMLDSIRIGIAPKPAYFNGLYTDISDTLLLYTEGGMTEGFAYTHWSGLVRGNSWRTQCNRGLSAQHRFGKTWLALGGAPFNDPDGRLYALASYLLVADSLSMYANATSYQEFAHFPEFDIPLGVPLESALLDVNELAHEWDGGTYHRREFEHGTVVVNAGEVPAVYPDGLARPALRLIGGITTDGGRVTCGTVGDTLRPGSAHIYLNLPPGEILASPVIHAITVHPGVVPADGSTSCEVRVLASDSSDASFL